MDENADGKIDTKELEKAFDSSEEVRSIFDCEYEGDAGDKKSFFQSIVGDIDTNGDGLISWQELLDECVVGVLPSSKVG